MNKFIDQTNPHFSTHRIEKEKNLWKRYFEMGGWK